MPDITYLDRTSKQEEKEKVYGKAFLEALYGDRFIAKILSLLFLPLIAKIPLFSKWYGALQKSPLSRRKIKPFISAFHINTQEFLDPVESFRSFNDFFIRKLKPESRPITSGHDVAILPADGRYLVYPNISQADGFLVKGKKFSLEDLLCNRVLAKRYTEGAMAIARLCPTDYHRFHFPCNCIPGRPRDISGDLFSVNPMALKKNIHILSSNKRTITSLTSKTFGEILYIEVGATYVGSIHQTFVPEEPYAKGDEKGYFSFGGSSLILLFEPGRIQFDQDLITASDTKTEMRGLIGQSLGRSFVPSGIDR